MRPDEIQVGYLKVGRFLLSIQSQVFSTTPIEDQTFFECLLFENIDNHFNYIDLRMDERFSLFKKFALFNEEISNEELLTFNSYIKRKNQTMPLYKLSRHMIAACIDLCNKLSRKK